jgi:hypothetical protein
MTGPGQVPESIAGLGVVAARFRVLTAQAEAMLDATAGGHAAENLRAIIHEIGELNAEMLTCVIDAAARGADRDQQEAHTRAALARWAPRLEELRDRLSPEQWHSYTAGEADEALRFCRIQAQECSLCIASAVGPAAVTEARHEHAERRARIAAALRTAHEGERAA